MVREVDDVIIRTAARILTPFIQIYGLYVFIHGHSSPGGGFQGGCIMAASFIMLCVAFDLGEVKKRLTERRNMIFCALGVLIYAGTGCLAVICSGNFLDYGALSGFLPTDPITARYYGMAMVELGVEITVMAVMVSIFVDLITSGRHGEGLEENRRD